MNKKKKKKKIQLYMMAHTCNPNTRKAEAGELRVGGQPGLHSENSSQKKKKESKRA
jgi:hypothetical protein